jgi:hypothetical protein
LYTRLKIAIAGKACKKLPAYGRKKACNPAGQRPVIKTNISARMPGKAAGLRLLGKAAGQGCMARVQYAPLSWQVTILQRQDTKLQWQDTKLQWQDTKLHVCTLQ